ncbi:MAG: metallophosphatase family protein [Betaproteobacteria bacterium]|nr:metallophosphatase family protein [Betaproteobacteria bacterium]
MILGVYADLHANLPALHAMQVAAGSVDQWVALGDSVGLYPQVNEVLNWQRLNNVLYVRGDHEEALMEGGGLAGSFTGTESLSKQAKVISKDNLGMLSAISDTCNFESNGIRMCVTHFLTPESRKTESKYSIDLSLLEKRYQKYDYVFFGHTHLPTILYGRNTVFINPGSAGFPVDVERRCSMVVFDTCNRRFELIRFDYDISTLIETIEMAGYNKKLIAYVRNEHRWI